MSTKQTSTRRAKAARTLAEWRSLREWDQREAAEFIGISQTYYSRLERHAASPRPAIAKLLTARTGVPVEELMGIAS